MHQQYGKIILIIGIIIMIIGIVVYFFGNKIPTPGSLPGDIKIDKGNTKIYIPITTMIILSILITVILRLINKLF
ncbi:DUF2905 domain-containing protein [Mangrovivirga cuniculi]|uniref:DUF2905 domain-containing protein n=1 Tax=Mangrovivirga cuniculi TaxID=2715131 RepID=A0A4D7JNA4_9BACT|nr:DUF2905 domain-containing protein [Mangrovivirga cuniculi]